MSATMVVGTSSSYCSECGQNVLTSQTVHDWTYGYRPRKGCGATFTHISTNYVGIDIKSFAARERPDLIWIDGPV